MTEYLPPDIIDSIIYRYKSAVLDNRHDFGLTAADLAKIEEQLKAAYQPYIYKSEKFCPIDYNPVISSTTANGLNIKDEDAFLQQIGINRQLAPLRNWGMRTIMPAPGTPSLASKYYTDFTKDHNVESDGGGKSTFKKFMEEVCPTGVWNLVVDTISTGIQVGIKDFACSNSAVGGGQSGGALENYQRLTWVNSAETTFDPAGKVVPRKGVGAIGFGKKTTGLGISPKVAEINGKEWCIREKTIPGHTLFPSFKTLNIRPGTPLKNFPNFNTPSAAAIHANAVKNKVICPPFADGQGCSQPSGPRINFFSNYDIHMSKDSKETRALMMRDEENDAWMANKDFAKRTTQIKNLSTTSILKSFKQLFKGLPGIRDALKIIFPTKLTTQHYVCKRLGDAGQALLCVAMDNCILITGDRPLVAIAMMYRVPVIIYNNTTHQGETWKVNENNKNNSYSIFHLNTMLSFENKVEQNKKLIDDLEGRLATLLSPGQGPGQAQRKTKEEILTAAKEKLKIITESISSLIAIVKVKLGEKVALEASEDRTLIKNAVDEGNRAWRVLILLLYYTMPLFDQYKSLKASKEVASVSTPFAPPSLVDTGDDEANLTDPQKDARSEIFKLYEERIALLQEKVGTLEFQKKMEKVFAPPLQDKDFDFVNKNPTLWDRPFGFIYILQQLIQSPSPGLLSNIIGKKILTKFKYDVLTSIADGATLSEKNFGTKGKLWKMSGAVKNTFKVALVDLLENYESATYSKPNGRGILSPNVILAYQSIERKVGSDRYEGTLGGTNLLFEILDILSGTSPTLDSGDAVEKVGIEIKELLTAIFKPVIVNEELDEKGEPTLNSKKQYPVNYTWIRRQQEAYHSTISKFLPQMSGGSMRGGDPSCPTNVTTTLTIQEDSIPARAVTSPPSGFAWKISFPAVENVLAKAEAGLNNNYLGYSNLTLTKNIYNNVITSTATLAFNLNLLKTMKYWEWSTEIENCLAYKVLHNFMIKMNFPIETRDTAYEVKMAPIYAKTDGNLKGGARPENPLQIMAEVGNSDFIEFLGNKKPELHEIPIPLIKALNKKLELENPRPNAEDASQILYDCKEESKIKPDLTIPPNKSQCTIGYPPFVAEAEKIVLNQEEKWAKATYRFFKSEGEEEREVLDAAFENLEMQENFRKDFIGAFELKGKNGKYGPGFYLKHGVEQAIFEYYYSPQYLRGVPTDGMNFDLSCATPVEKLNVIKATVIRIFLGNLADIIDNAQSVPFEPGSQCVEEIADPQATTSSNVLNDAPTRVPINMVVIEMVIERFIHTMTILDIGGKDCLLKAVNTTDQAIVVLDEIVDTSEYFKSNIFPTQYNEPESDEKFFELCVEPLFIMLNEQRNMFYEQGDSLLLEKMAEKTKDKCTEKVFAEEALQSVVERREDKRRRLLQAALKRRRKGGKKTRRKKRKRYKTKRKKKRKQKRRKKKTKRKRRKKHKTKYSKH